MFEPKSPDPTSPDYIRNFLTDDPIYEYVREGCAVNLPNCTRGDRAITARALNPRGEPRNTYHLVCLDSADEKLMARVSGLPGTVS